MTERTCKGCGCSQRSACVDPVLGPCWWVEEDLCSHCRIAVQALQRLTQNADDLDQVCVTMDVGHALQLQRMTAWLLSLPTIDVVNQVRAGVEALATRATALSVQNCHRDCTGHSGTDNLNE